MLEHILNRMPWANLEVRDDEALLTREWLVTNGLGGYASGSISGACTRRYHGLLIAALPAPLGRTLMLNHLAEEMRLPDGRVLRLGSAERPGGLRELDGASTLAEFRLEAGLPVWRYEFGSWILEKRVLLPHGQNTVHIEYQLLAGEGPVRLRLRPSVHFRSHDASVATKPNYPYSVTLTGPRVEVCAETFPPLRMLLRCADGALVIDGGQSRDVFYRVEAERGYDSHGILWSPGYFRLNLAPGQTTTLSASTEHWDCMLASSPAEARNAERDRRYRLIAQADPSAQHDAAAELVLAADQFIITPNTRMADAARAHAAGDEIRTVIAGYHWFTDWGRDTMISLEGLSLVTGRHTEAGYILRTFGQYIRDGLIPNLFPEGENQGLYHTADATLWFFHALARYVHYTNDRATLRLLLPALQSIIEHHVRGTRFNIHIDPRDGLFTQGQEGYQLTWMDAKVDDWVVTPRRGKAVELNALWYNALCLLANWLREENQADEADKLAAQAQRCRESFNKRFWYEHGGYLYDVVDGEHGDDSALRPNQVFAISLEHPVLEKRRWQSVLDVVVARLLTPMGLRSLAPGQPDYKPRYDGDLRSRDAAYHQGTVWGWLAGPFVDAWLAVNPGDVQTAREFLTGFKGHLGEACIGSISEIFDAEAPYTPRGCIAQAWSVAEVLRAWVKTAPADPQNNSVGELAEAAATH